MESFEAAALGISRLNGIRMEAAASFGEEVNDQEENDRNQRLKSNLFSMILISLLVVLESMVKDYAEFLLSPNHEYDDTPEDSESQDDTVYRYYKIGTEHNQKFWKKKIGNWVDEATAESDKDSRAIVKCKMQLCAVSLEKWPFLLESIVIRNLVIHNSGVMNEQNHCQVPICEIGERPKWDKDLIYELFDTIRLLNTQFARMRLE